MNDRYTAPGDMTVVAWHAWFVITVENGDDRIEHFTSHNGDVWGDLPDDGCLGVRLIHDAQVSPCCHYAVTLVGQWYYHAKSNLGDIWNATDDVERDCREGRYKDLSVKQGKTVPFEIFAPLQEVMSRTVE